MPKVALKAARSSRPTSARATARVSAVVVWVVWSLLSVGAVGFVALYGSSVPYYDDWDLVDRLTGVEPVTPTWLWELHNSHRLPVPKVLGLGLLKVSGIDFRSEMFASVAALSAAAAAMIWTARRVRGWTSYTDAFFPLLLLHGGLCRVLLWGWQLHVILSMVLPCVPLLVIVRQGSQPPLTRTILAWACILLLPLCGANGLAFVPALAVWLGCLAVVYWRSPHPNRRGRGLLVGGMAVSAFLLVPLHYVVQYVKEDETLPFNLRAAVGTTVKFLALNFGPVAKVLWPVSGWVVLGLLALSGLILAGQVLGRRPAGNRAGASALASARGGPEQPRALGLLLFLGGVASLAIGFGTGRAYRGNILEPHWVLHYWVFAVPAFYFLYFTWVVYGPSLLRRLVTGALFTFQLLIFPYTAYEGMAYAREMRRDMAAFEHDLVRGDPVFVLTSRYANTLCPTQTQYTRQIQPDLGRRLRELRQAGIGLFKYLRDDPPFGAVNLEVTPAAVHEGTWDGEVFQGSGKGSFVEFALPKARFVYGIRLKYTYVQTTQMFSQFQVVWREARDRPFPEELQYAFVTYCPWVVPSYHGEGPSDCEDPVLVAVRSTLDGFRIYPESHGPFRFKIQEITLLVPPVGVPPSPGGG